MFSASRPKAKSEMSIKVSQLMITYIIILKMFSALNFVRDLIVNILMIIDFVLETKM